MNKTLYERRMSAYKKCSGNGRNRQNINIIVNESRKNIKRYWNGPLQERSMPQLLPRLGRSVVIQNKGRDHAAAAGNICKFG